MGRVGKTVVLSDLTENENTEVLSELLQTKQSKCVCICPFMYWICSQMLKWEGGDQTGALGVAGGDKLQTTWRMQVTMEVD